jgi:hypothetical protein
VNALSAVRLIGPQEVGMLGAEAIIAPLSPGGWPELAPPGQQPPWPAWQDDPADSVPAWPPQRPPRWPRQPR